MLKTNRGRGGQPGNRNAAKGGKFQKELEEIYQELERIEVNEAMRINTEVTFRLEGNEITLELDGSENFFKGDST